MKTNTHHRKNTRSHARRWHGANFALAGGAAALFTLSIIISPNLYSEGVGQIANAVVSASASVLPNPYNTLAEELARKEALLNERGALVGGEVFRAPDTEYALYSLLMSLALFCLLALNFYFDWRRSRQKTLVTS